MGRASAQTSTPPPLRALGGWLDADWFCPSVLRDDDVVGFTFPKLPGSRKQNFRLVERSGARDGSQVARRPHSGIGLILDAAEATCAAAFRRTTFLFEAPAVLYFAEMPAAKLKIRSADQLRRDLIANGLRGCALNVGGRSVTAMFWPSAEPEITQFVEAAAPPYPLHAQFAQAEAAGRGPDQAERPAGTPAASGLAERERRRFETERKALVEELADLRARVAELQRSQSTLGALETLGLDDARLKSMLRLLHPDRHGNSEAATEAAKWVNNLRDVLRSGTRQSA